MKDKEFDGIAGFQRIKARWKELFTDGTEERRNNQAYIVMTK